MCARLSFPCPLRYICYTALINQYLVQLPTVASSDLPAARLLKVSDTVLEEKGLFDQGGWIMYYDNNYTTHCGALGAFECRVQ